MPTYPVTEPLDSGMLDVGYGQRIWWETAGNQNGKPAVLLHGGPGSGSSPRWRRWFNPERYLIVQFDQRQCGRSEPNAGASAKVDLSTNTTDHLIADIEMLRKALEIDAWLVWGGSWGTTLALAYAETHPRRVTEMILGSVTTTTNREVDWVTRQMGRIFPTQWDKFVHHLPEPERGGNLAAAYARLLQDPDPVVHQAAAAAWCKWEDTHVATVPGYQPDPRYQDPRFRLCLARLVTHYWANAAFRGDDELLDHVHRLGSIPGVLLHGKLDISSPLDIPWQLAREWPGAELVVIGDEGHHGGDAMTTATIAATDRFARRLA
jgi:proline iminopeptidase